MAREEKKELLLKDICARLPYNCIISIAEGGIDGIKWADVTLNSYLFYQIMEEDAWEYVKPYFRPLSSMTNEEYNELSKISSYYGLAPFEDIHNWTPNYNVIDWLNAHHFDYRGLIEKGLALEAPEGMYNN